MEHEARLHPAVQAVDVSLPVRGRVVRAVVSRSVFEAHFGATEAPESWLRAYADNAAAIRAVIERKAALQPEARVVVLLEGDFGCDPAARKEPVRAGRAAAAKPPRAA